MSVEIPSAPSVPRGPPGLRWGAVPIVAGSAAFTFLIQPVVGKFLVPQVGGGAGLWVTTMCFFQTALFLGYGLAHLLRSQSLARQAAVTAALGVLAFATFQLPPAPVPPGGGWWEIIRVLGAGMLAAVVLTTSLGIFLQGWIGALHGRVPFWLYGVSNGGSLVALLIYPFWIEPAVELTVQAQVLRGLLGVLVAAGLVAAFVVWRSGGASRSRAEGEETLSPWRVLGWVAGAALTCGWLIAATNLLQAEIGSNPLAWVLPFGIYLLGFSLAFVPRWPGWVRWITAGLLGVAHVAFLLGRGVRHLGVMGTPSLWLLLALFAGCLFVHRELYLARPERRYSVFYLALAAGGMLAGFGGSLLLPNVLPRPVEFVAWGGLIAALAAARLQPRWTRQWRWSAAVLVLVGTVAVAAWQIRDEDRDGVRTRTLRNHYGTVVLRVTRQHLSLASESTLHGLQALAPAQRREPTGYYGRGTALGRVLRGVQEAKPAVRMGVVGLGVGTAAAYLRREDECVFWEINPLMADVARDAFSFLRDAPGRVGVELIDGRLGVERWSGTFDVLLLDAFSGDGVPAHLLTREAFTAYRRKAPDGVILCHISNHHIDLFPVLAGHARALGWRAFAVHSTPPTINGAAGMFEFPARYAILCAPDRLPEIRSWFDPSGAGGTRYALVEDSAVTPVDWTDGRHAIIDVLQLRAAPSLRGE